MPVSAKTRWLFLVLTTAAGHRAVAEATQPVEDRSVEREFALLATVLAGHDIAHIDSLLAGLLADHPSPARRAALTAIESALLIARAETAGIPVAGLLGGARRSRVRVYANINRGVVERTPEAFARSARQAVAAGYTAVKIAPFDGVSAGGDGQHELLAAGLDRIAAVGEALGSTATLMVDCHWRLTPAQASEVAAACVAAGVGWLEDPLPDTIPAESARALRSMANARGLRIAGGEHLRDRREAAALLDREAHDVLLPDLRTTGVREGLAMLALAAAWRVEPSLHNPAGPVLDLLSLQAAAASDAPVLVERQVGENPLYGLFRGGDAAITAGETAVPAGPGLGQGIDLDAIRARARQAGDG